MKRYASCKVCLCDGYTKLQANTALKLEDAALQ